MKVLTNILCGGMCAVFLAGCASSGPYVPNLPSQAKASYMDYQNRPANKVFVVAVDLNGNFAVGYDYGKATKEAAYNVALAQCEENCEKYGVLTDPVVYDINGKVVFEKALQQAWAE